MLAKMSPVVQFLKQAGRHAYNVVRWCAYEFLPWSVRNTVSARVTDFCRLLGFVTIVSLMMFQTRGIALTRLSDAWYVWVLDGILAILIGNVVKECAIWLGARITNWFGVDFYRRGVTLGGNSFSEVIHTDGTWRRCEYSDQETICEWTDRFGAINRTVTAPRQELRRAWGRGSPKSDEVRKRSSGPR
jgi:hypothetical protein